MEFIKNVYLVVVRPVNQFWSNNMVALYSKQSELIFSDGMTLLLTILVQIISCLHTVNKT